MFAILMFTGEEIYENYVCIDVRCLQKPFQGKRFMRTMAPFSSILEGLIDATG